MKIQGLFLASRTGRRIFWSLLLAAALPLMLFGVAVHHSFADHLQAQAHRQRLQATKYVGLGLLDKLLAARTVLAAAPLAGAQGPTLPRGAVRGRVLSGVASVSIEGELLAGDAALWQRWRALAGTWHDKGHATSAHLVLGHELAGGGRVPVLIVLHDPVDAHRLWLAEIDDDFLFGEITATGAGADICVHDAKGRALACAERSEPHAASALHSAAASWRLFLHNDFGVPDWVLTHEGDQNDGALAAQSVAQTAFLGALAALLVVALLSLGQVRRTMVPLERLMGGTRRLSGGDFSVRVQHDEADEFGQLARSFNHMAERIGRQVQAMQVQSDIDREILDGLDVARILRQVVLRLGALVPGASVGVIEFDRALPTLVRVHRGDGSVTVSSRPHDDALGAASPDPDALQRCDPAPGWLRQALPLPQGPVFLRGARSGGQTLALLVLGVELEAIDEAPALREIVELSDRVAVALASADRERRLFERATRDSLTGLFNRFGLFEHLEQRLAPGTDSAPLSLLFVDLDGFKDVNDALGHQAGDALLCALAQRLSQCAGAQAFVARPGGDEFVIALPGARAAAQSLADAVLEQMRRPVDVAGRVLTVACSIGMAHHPDDGDSVTDLMRRADMAMYQAKVDGGHRHVWYTPAMGQRLAERTALLADLRLAQARGELELHYQPRVHSRSGESRCAEALLRWRRGGELVPPARFIGLLEDSGLIESVGLWAIEAACRQLVAWRAGGLRLDSVAVNVSTPQLHDAGFAQRVLAIVQRCGLQPQDLELEITESVFIGKAGDAIASLQALRQAGVGLALDDFGTGYSSLSYLHTLPITCLKVDRSFVAELGQRDSALALTRTVVALAGALRLQVVAEGVETSQQAALLRDLGCEKLQGFLFSRALAANAFERWCRERSAELAA